MLDCSPCKASTHETPTLRMQWQYSTWSCPSSSIQQALAVGGTRAYDGGDMHLDKKSKDKPSVLRSCVKLICSSKYFTWKVPVILLGDTFSEL